MIIVVLIFIICNAPARILQTVYNEKPKLCSVTWWTVQLVTSLEVVNSAVNFLIYCAFRANFRQILLDIICFRKSSTQKKVDETSRKRLLDGKTTDTEV